MGLGTRTSVTVADAMSVARRMRRAVRLFAKATVSTPTKHLESLGFATETRGTRSAEGITTPKRRLLKIELSTPSAKACSFVARVKSAAIVAARSKHITTTTISHSIFAGYVDGITPCITWQLLNSGAA